MERGRRARSGAGIACSGSSGWCAARPGGRAVAVTLGLLLLLLAPPAAAQAGGGAAADAAAAGEAAYARACARCHADPRAIGGRAARLDDPARRAMLERFLARHHAPDATERAAIAAWMAEAGAR